MTVWLEQLGRVVGEVVVVPAAISEVEGGVVALGGTDRGRGVAARVLAQAPSAEVTANSASTDLIRLGATMGSRPYQ
jgi:hypothetical protein